MKQNEGVLKSEKWGFLTFSRESLEVKNQISASMPVYKLVRSGQTVRYRCCTATPSQKEWTVISVTPNGEIRNGQGHVVLAQETYAFVHSDDFGDIYVPYQAIKVRRVGSALLKDTRLAAFKGLKVGSEVEFEITKSLPHGRCRWRAVSLTIKSQ